jgi:hypothetical protein
MGVRGLEKTSFKVMVFCEVLSSSLVDISVSEEPAALIFRMAKVKYKRKNK